MSLNLAGLKTDLKAVYDATKVDAGDPATQEQNFINGLATAIDTYVKTAQINYTGGLTAGSNTVVGTFGGDLT